MSGADARAPAPARRALPLAPQRYGTIVVVGGGCYGSYYVRQLRRAMQAGALHAERVLVVDRDPECRVAGELAAAGTERGPFELVVGDWEAFFDAYLGAGADAPHTVAADAIVPSPLMPHLMYRWLVARARARWPGRTVSTPPLPRAPNTPWQQATPDGTHLVSFAEWMCPINCVEPAVCPEIRGPRTWSMPRAVEAFTAAERRRGALGEALVLHCRHRAYGVGMFDTREVLDADAQVRAQGEHGRADFVVATVSHCHGVLNRLVVAPPAG